MLNYFGEKAMKVLEDNTGEDIQASYVIAGEPCLAGGKLKSILRFGHIEVETLSVSKVDFRGNLNRTVVGASLLRIPFLGMRIAIQKIEKRESSEVIYDNFLITDDYNLANPAGLLELAELLYGQTRQSG